jgi:hypothetical protein
MNNLNSRERTLLLIMLSFLPLGLLYYGWSTYRGMRLYRQDLLIQRQEEKLRLQDLSATAMRELDRLDDVYNQASLPLTVAANTAMYQNYLSALLSRHGLEFNLGTSKPEPVYVETLDRFRKPIKELVFERLTISDTNAKGTLAQLTNFLHDFYDVALLHRIDSMSIDLAAPDKEDDNRLSIKFTASAAILLSGPEAKPWDQYAVGRLNQTREKLAETTVARDLFGPPNVAPRITSRNSAEIQVGSNFTHRVTATDGNETDRLTFELLSSELPGFELVTAERGRTATLQGPRIAKTGRYRFQFRVSDNRIPLLTDTQTFTLTVREPEPPREPRRDPPPPPKRYAPDTYITALVEGRQGIASVILVNRATDEETRLTEGESFQLDGKTWTVVKVDRRTVTLRAADELLEYRVGSALDNPLSVSKAVTSTEGPPR